MLIQNQPFDSSKSNMYIYTLLIQMATIRFLEIIHVDTKPTISPWRFQLFSYKWRNLIPPNHTYWNKTNLFSLGICQLFWYKWIQTNLVLLPDFNYFGTNVNNLIPPNHTCIYKTNFLIGRFQLFWYKWQQLDSSKSYQLITKQTFSLGRFQLLSYKWDKFDPPNHSCWTISPWRFQLFSYKWQQFDSSKSYMYILFSYKWQQFDSSKAYMLIQNQTFLSEDFNYFHTNGDDWIPPNHTCWYITNHFSLNISTIFIQLATIWFIHIIHVYTKPTISLWRFQLFSYKWLKFDSSKSYMLKQNQHFLSRHMSTFFIQMDTNQPCSLGRFQLFWYQCQ